ncbi:hypothetical protein [Pseudomonas aeruginosa]|uniref:hypothetical protein n=1 Tax=Pseudomonas aeruginosa TaxID=287 RepID=UPI003D6DE36A
MNLEQLAEAATVQGRRELELADLQRLNLELYHRRGPEPEDFERGLGKNPAQPLHGR